MKKVKFLISALLIATTSVFAQDHQHGSPHGGEVKTAGKEFHIETVVKGGMMFFYLLDANEKPLNISKATANATIQTVDGKILKASLKASDKSKFAYKLNPAVKYNKAIVTIKTGGKTASASFNLNKKPDSHNHNEEGHKH